MTDRNELIRHPETMGSEGILEFLTRIGIGVC